MWLLEPDLSEVSTREFIRRKAARWDNYLMHGEYARYLILDFLQEQRLDLSESDEGE